MYNNLNIIVLLIIVTDNINHNLASENTNLYHSLRLVIKQTFIGENSRPVIFVNFNSSSKKDLFFANDFVNDVLYDLSNATYKLFYHYQKEYHNVIHSEVVVLDNLESFRYFFSELYNIGNMNLSRTLMFISSLTTLDFATISLVFKDLYHMSILKVALVVKLAPDNIVMLTYFPFTPTGCHDVKPVIINRYLPDRQRWANLEYYPEKLQNFHGCPLTTCVWNEMPYFGIKYAPENGSVVDFVGIEADLLKFVAKNKNFSIILHVMSNDEPKEMYLRNEGHLFRKLFSETCDFALGAFPRQKRFNHLSAFSQSNHYFLSYIQMVTNVVKVHSTYENMAFPFHYIVWYTLGFTLAISSLVICTFERRRQWRIYRNFLIGAVNKTPHFNLYAVAVGVNLTNTQIPKRNFSRFLLTCWLLATFVLRSAYQSGMYQMLRDNMQWNPPHTIEQVFKENYLISMIPENRKYLPILPEVNRMRILNATIMSTFPELLNAKEPIAFITPYEYFGYLGKTNVTQWQQLHLVTERLVTQQLSIYVRHHSHLIQELNEQIFNAQHYGYMGRVILQYLLPSEASLDNDIDNNDNSEIKALSMQELGAIFMILIWFNLITVIVFLIELMWYNYGKQLKNIKVKLKK